MAKARVVDTGGKSNKIRVVMLDAELSDGAVSDFTNVLLNAFRQVQPRALDRKAIASENGAANGAHQQELLLDGGESEPEDQHEDEATDASVPKAPKSTAKRTYKKPEVLDLNMKGDGVTFLGYVKKHAPTSDSRRYLVASAWFQEYGKHATVNIDKIYTAYRTAGWPFAQIQDWGQIFRTLDHQGWMRRKSRGEYEVTTPGLGRVEKPETPEESD
jgi:hypothetical protein